jgi:hypothetical protein
VKNELLTHAIGRTPEEVRSMMRRIAVAVLAVLFVAGFAVAADMKATGTVKAVANDSLTITDSAAKDWTFAVDKETMVVARGASHKMDKLKEDGKPTTISEFVAVKNDVTVTYVEKDGKKVAKEVHVK